MPKASAAPRAQRTASRAATVAPPPSHDASALHSALLDSRQRWRDLVHLAADFAFETDAWGRFVFVSPDPALGWSAATLLGQTADVLLVEAAGATCFNPFRPTEPVRRRRAWLKLPEGGSLCLNFAAAPLLDGDGRIVGARGVGQDMSEQERRDADVAGALRRGEVLDYILQGMRQEKLPTRMMQATLDALGHATGCEGLALLDSGGRGADPAALCASGRQAASVIVAATSLLDTGPDDIAQQRAQDGRLVLVCPIVVRQPGVVTALAMWREPGSRVWDDDERALANATAAIFRVILERDVFQRELTRQARTDPLTGLLNRRAFIDEMARRFDRLEVDGVPGTLMYVDLDNFKVLNDSRGHDAGDEALRIVARFLLATVRPMDLVARLGGDEFGLWLDSADELAAAERAEHLRVAGPAAVAHLTPDGLPKVGMSIGIAARWPGRCEDVERLMERADLAMYAAKHSGRGVWRVAPSSDLA